MKSWSCLHCCDSIAEFGSYVKISTVAYSHLQCYNKAVAVDIRRQIQNEALQATADDAERRKEAAIVAWRAAPRCPKCGIPMLSERPESLPDAFSTVLSSNGSTCTLCVRQEAGLRAAARGREVLPPAPKTAPLYSPEELRDMGAPQKSADQELIRKAKEAGTPAIEIE